MNLYSINIPTYSQNYFSFIANVGSLTFKFTFRYVNKWQCWATLPDGTIRHIGVNPNVLNWSKHLDYSVFFYTQSDSINYDTLSSCTIGLVLWT